MNVIDMQALRLPEARSSRWQILRAGIQNLWEYDDQRFVFHRGRLLLRGQNESGKTKALEVLLPFLLDASLQPGRLDPFGSTARPMRWNLLNDRNAGVNVRIGYVWLELGRVEEGVPRYCTIGAGLRARRAANTVDDWYFRTNQRIDSELTLVEGAIPLERPALARAIGAHGQVYERSVDYRRSVNDELFGMPEDQYGTLIDALLQLRRPQLSKQLDPQGLSRILTASLPPLDRQVVGALAEGFERLDRHRDELDEVLGSLATLRRFLKVYKGYVAASVKAAAQELTRGDSAYHGARNALRTAQEKLATLERQREAIAATLVQLGHEEDELAQRIATLKASDAYRAVQELDQAIAIAQRESSRASAERTRSEAERMAASQARGRADLAQATCAGQQEKVRQLRARAVARAEAASLGDDHGAVDALIDSGDLAAAEGAIRSLHERRNAHLAQLGKLARMVAGARADVEKAARRVTEAEERVARCSERLAQAEAAEQAARERFSAALATWADSLQVLLLDHAALAETEPAQVRALVEDAAVAVREAHADRLASCRVALEGVRGELGLTRGEFDELQARTHQPPPAIGWRSPRGAERPGAPLYMCLDFVAGMNPGAQAAIEGALQAAGLLDAWVDPDGRLLDPTTFDLVLRPAPQPGRTLTEVLAPVAGPVPATTIDAVLRSIALIDEGEPDEASWIALDGRFRLGVLHGALRKENVQYVGAAAREQARKVRLAELEARIASLARREEEAKRAVDRVDAEGKALAAELRRLPDIAPLLKCQAEVGAAAASLGDERRAQHDARDASVKAQAAHRNALAALHEKGAQLELRAWVDRLEELRDATGRWTEQARDLLHQAEHLASARRAAEERDADLLRAQARADEAHATAGAAEAEARKAKATADALRDTVGASKDELLGAIRAAEDRQREVRSDRSRGAEAQERTAGEIGAAGTDVQRENERVEATELARRAADEAFRAIAQRALLRHVGIDAFEKPAEEWSYTDSLLVARQADEAAGSIDCSTEARERALNKVTGGQQELTRGLRGEIRVLGEQSGGITEYRATWNGRLFGVLELAEALEADVRSREALLGSEEQELFESFLSGETHQHLRSRLREARQLVDRMNEQLDDRPTSSGMRMRLKWEQHEDAPIGTKEAIDLLLRAGHLLADGDRTALRTFLQQRLADARSRDGAGSLQERMMAVLDYREWFTFQVEFRTATDPWKRVTRKTHGAGSGGQKSVMLHLPLFAAAAAFYESAAPHALRLILLDEAFAGIDRTTRAQLMGLLAQFDLDFVMTSFEEWGFYTQLDGLSTYHLAREPGMPGVYAEWFLWDGAEALQVRTP